MKIAYFTNQYPKVSHTFIRREIAALETLGCPVERFSLRGSPEELADPADRAEVERTRVILDDGSAQRLAAAVTRLSVKRPLKFAEASRVAASMSRLSERPAMTAAYLAEACVLTEWCEQAEVDHLHVHFGTNPATVAMLARILGGPSYSFTVHGPEEFDKPIMLNLKEKIERSAFTVAISHYGTSQLYRQVGHEHWSKIHIVRCGVDGQFFEHEAQPVSDSNRLVCVGRLSEQKGQLLLLDAAAMLKADGVDFKLVLVGDGEMRGEVEARIAASGLENHVEITGWASGDEVRAELLKGRALCLPSFAEGLPVVIMEALALQRPVLSSYVAGIPELVVPGESGWLVPAGARELLAQKMKEVLSTDLDSLRRLGARGRAMAQESHDVKKNAAHLHELFVQYAGR